MGMFDWFTGTQDKFKQLSRFSPEQSQGFQNYWNNPITNDPTYQSGNQYIQNLLSGNPEAYAAFEAPLMRQFQEQTIPGIAERFTGMGTGAGAGNSSALYNSLARAGTDFSTNIANLRGNMQMQALPQALQYSQQPYSNMMQGFGASPFENVMMQGQPGFGQQALNTLGQGAGIGFGAYGAKNFGNKFF